MSHSYKPCPICEQEMDIELNSMGKEINHHVCYKAMWQELKDNSGNQKACLLEIERRHGGKG